MDRRTSSPPASARPTTSRWRELAEFDLDPNDFILYHHQMTEYPHVLDTCKLASLGWESTTVGVATKRTVEESLASGRDGSAHDPGGDVEERLPEAVAR